MEGKKIIKVEIKIIYVFCQTLLYTCCLQDFTESSDSQNRFTFRKCYLSYYFSRRVLRSAKGKELNWSSVLLLFEVLFKNLLLIWNTINSSKRSKNLKNSDSDVSVTSMQNVRLSLMLAAPCSKATQQRHEYTSNTIIRGQGKDVRIFRRCFFCMKIFFFSFPFTNRLK